MKLSKKCKKVDSIQSNKKYDECMSYIRSAIDCLSECIDDSEDSVIARDSLANLSVIYFDLQSR